LDFLVLGLVQSLFQPQLDKLTTAQMRERRLEKSGVAWDIFSVQISAISRQGAYDI
jgi:hypothetical protein